jgi:hypothetical protein
MDEKPLEQARTGVALVGEVLKLAGDNPDTRAAGKELGKAALTISTAINNVLLPVAAVNFGFAKAREYFDKRFSDDFRDKAERIPPESVVEPKPSIAAPVLQGLAFSHDEPDLKELYLSLLASSMDSRNASLPHPAFAEVIRQLTSDEARLLRSVLNAPSLPIIEIRLVAEARSAWTPLLSPVIDFFDKTTREPRILPRVPSMVDNWSRLGLVSTTFNRQAKADDESDPYAWADRRPELLGLKTQHELGDRKVIFVKGILLRTSFGKEFARAVGIIESTA